MAPVPHLFKYAVITTAALVSLPGCEPENRRLQVIPIPESATVREEKDGGVTGVGIAVGIYRSSQMTKKKDGCFHLKGYTATWPSGAQASTGLIRWCNTQYPGMTIYIDRPKDAPHLELDNKLERAREARQDLELQQAELAKAQRESNGSTDEPEDEEDQQADEDEDIGMAGALGIITQAALNSHAISRGSATDRVTPATTGARAQQRQLTAAQNSVAAGLTAALPESRAARDSGSNSPYDYESAHPECVSYERHPTLKAYAQYRNTCAFKVQVLYCAVAKNGNDNCAKRIFGSFELAGGATNIAQGSDTSVKFVVCRSPFQAVGSKVTFSGGELSVPCQKNK
jgi:hypothetical protein